MASQNLIGKRVQSLREASGKTQDDLASVCQRLGWDLSRVTLTKIETGVRRVNDGELVVLAAALKCNASDLIDKISVKEAIRTVRQGGANG